MGSRSKASPRRLVLSSMVAAAALAGWFAYARFHDEVHPISADQAIEEFVETAAAATSTSLNSTVTSTVSPSTTTSLAGATSRVMTLPAPGIYRFSGSGFETVDALTKPRHDYPTETAIVVAIADCGVTITWAPLRERRESWLMCLGPGDRGLRLISYQTTHEFFGTGDQRDLLCGPSAWIVAPDAQLGDVGTETCTGSQLVEARQTTYIGTSSISVGGRQLEAIELEVRITTSGSSVGTTLRSLTLDATTGFPLIWTDVVDNDSDTAIGNVHYVERFTVKADSTTPAA